MDKQILCISVWYIWTYVCMPVSALLQYHLWLFINLYFILFNLILYTINSCSKHKISTTRAADWLFSHADDLDAAVAEVTTSNRLSSATSTGAGAAAVSPVDDGEGKYTLMAIISHIGKSTESGHYVCHIKNKLGQWVLYNDEKVGKCSKAPLDYGFMYLYKRDDGPGTFSS